jgi:hypothetical protein
MMTNGKSTRDYVIETHTNVNNIKEWIDRHEKNHKWVWGMIVLMPPAISALLKILGV